MNTTTAYTPLESLLLFQSLVAFGTREEDFIRISDLLTNNALVKDEKTYDARRLTVESLRGLYLRLLRDELRAEEQDTEDTLSKKRKIQSPPLPSLQDAQEYGDKLPLVVDRLYARYRDCTIQAIREEERRYAKLQNEIAEIERGEWDDKISTEVKSVVNGVAPSEPTPSKSNGTNVPHTFQEAAIKSSTSSALKGSPLQPPTNLRSEAHLPTEATATQSQKTAPTPADKPRTDPPKNSASHARNGSAGPHGLSPLQAGVQPGHVPPPQNLGWAPPYQPGPPAGTPQYGHQFQPPFQHQQGPPRGASPLIPPPFGAVPSSPVGSHPPAYAQNAVPLTQAQHRASPHSPAQQYHNPTDVNSHGQHIVQNHNQSQTPLPHSPHPPPFRGGSGSPLVPQSPLGFPPHYVPRPSSGAGGQYQQWPQGPLPPHSPHYPPNYAQNYGQPPQPFPPPQPTSHQPQKYSSPYHHGKHPQPQGLLRSQMSNPSTPRNRPSSYTTGFGTKWTPTPTGRTPGPYDRVERPTMEILSPVAKPAELVKMSRQAPEPVPQEQSVSKSKSSKRGKQRARAGSAESTATGPTRRSQSVLSHADELSLDEAVIRQVKEEVNTPRGVEDLGDTTADESSAQPQPSTLRSRSTMKRKRGVSTLGPRPEGPATHVLWTRAFPKISSSALQSVEAHKSAGTFAQPVKERDAPNYKHSVLRPQDLKSIRSAITAGNRAAAAAAPADLGPNATSVWLPISEELIPPKGIINYSQFEKELMRMFANAIMFNPDPDRGLGKRWRVMNNDQGDVLGYAFDEDSVVKETKAMFTDVEAIIEALRAAERRSEDIKDKERDSSTAAREVDDDDIDELAGDGEPHSGMMGSVAKRRRKA